MAPRTRIALVVLALIALAGAAVATLAARSSSEDEPAAEVTERSRGGVAAPRSAFKGAVRPAGGRATDFALRNQDGELIRLAKLRGKVVVLSPMYPTCRDTCPLVSQPIRAALDDLPDSARRDVVALALSVDPVNDTPGKAKEFLFKRRVDQHLDFLLGSAGELRPIWKAYGFSPQTEKLEHNSYVILIDRRGHQRVGFPVNFLTPEALAHDLRLLVRERA
jgi:protein SCO1/2